MKLYESRDLQTTKNKGYFCDVLLQNAVSQQQMCSERRVLTDYTRKNKRISFIPSAGDWCGKTTFVWRISASVLFKGSVAIWKWEQYGAAKV